MRLLTTETTTVPSMRSSILHRGSYRVNKAVLMLHTDLLELALTNLKLKLTTTIYEGRSENKALIPWKAIVWLKI